MHSRFFCIWVQRKYRETVRSSHPRRCSRTRFRVLPWPERPCQHVLEVVNVQKNVSLVVDTCENNNRTPSKIRLLLNLKLENMYSSRKPAHPDGSDSSRQSSKEHKILLTAVSIWPLSNLRRRHPWASRSFWIKFSVPNVF